MNALTALAIVTTNETEAAIQHLTDRHGLIISPPELVAATDLLFAMVCGKTLTIRSIVLTWFEVQELITKDPNVDLYISQASDTGPAILLFEVLAHCLIEERDAQFTVVLYRALAGR